MRSRCSGIRSVGRPRSPMRLASRTWSRGALRSRRWVSVELEDAEAEGAGEEMEALAARHRDAPWYPEAKVVWDTWTERVLATDDPHEVEHMMATVLPLYTAHPDRPEIAAALAEFSNDLKARSRGDQGLGKRLVPRRRSPPHPGARADAHARGSRRVGPDLRSRPSSPYRGRFAERDAGAHPRLRAYARPRRHPSCSGTP